jgi:hypothetical protein
VFAVTETWYDSNGLIRRVRVAVEYPSTVRTLYSEVSTFFKLAPVGHEPKRPVSRVAMIFLETILEVLAGKSAPWGVEGEGEDCKRECEWECENWNQERVKVERLMI